MARVPSWTSTSAPTPGEAILKPPPPPPPAGAEYEGAAYCCAGGGANEVGGGGAYPPGPPGPPRPMLVLAARCGATGGGVSCADEASRKVTTTRLSPNMISSPDWRRVLLMRSPLTSVPRVE